MGRAAGEPWTEARKYSIIAAKRGASGGEFGAENNYEVKRRRLTEVVLSTWGEGVGEDEMAMWKGWGCLKDCS